MDHRRRWMEMRGGSRGRDAATRVAAGLALAVLCAGAPARAGENLQELRARPGSVVNRCADSDILGFVNVRWDGSVLPVGWRLHSSGVFNNTNHGGVELSVSQAVAILEQAFAQWNDIPQSAAAAVLDRECRLTGVHTGIECLEGLTSTALAGADGENLLSWTDPTAVNVGAIAVTLVTSLTEDVTLSATDPFDRDLNGDGTDDISLNLYPDGTRLPAGTILDADISFNARDLDYVTEPGATGDLVDLLGVGLHEQGHWFGLSHSPLWAPVPTMFPIIDLFSVARQLEHRTLEADDRASAARFYPLEPGYSESFGAIRGRLVSASGAPVAGEPVVAIDAVTLDAAVFGLSAHALQEEFSGAGFFSIEGLPPGDYLLQVGALDASFLHLQRQRYNLTTFCSTWTGHRPALAVAGQETAADDLLEARRMRVRPLKEAGPLDAGTIVVNTEPPSAAPLAGAMPLQFGDNQALLVDLPGDFAFPFYGTAYGRLFVYDNGYVTFPDPLDPSPAPDPISTITGTSFAAESLGSFLNNSPRVGVLYRNHDPSTDNRRQDAGPIDVYYTAQTGSVTFTWAVVPEVLLTFSPGGAINGDRPARADTVALTLFASGEIEMSYGSLGTPYGIVGITPGGPGVPFFAADLSRAAFVQAGPGAAVGQVFSMGRLDFSLLVTRFLDGLDLTGGRVRFVPVTATSYAVMRPDLRPAEVSGPGSSMPLVASGTAPTLLSWEPSAALFNLYRGLVSALRSTGLYTPDSGSCLASALTQAGFEDPQTPASGDSFYYLVTGENAAGVEGTLGSDSAGDERTQTTSCP